MVGPDVRCVERAHVTPALADAYGAAAAGWERGPARLYERMAKLLVSFAGPLEGRRVLDVGTGSGAAARALVDEGALVAATDLSWGMLAERRETRPAAAVGEICRLPFRTGVFDGAIAAFVVNHVNDSADALREMGRVCRPSGVVLASSFAAGVEPEVKGVVEDVAVRFGWSRPSWYAELKANCGTSVETAEQLLAGYERAGLVGTQCWVEEVSFADLPSEAIASWRLWTPAMAPFVESLPHARRHELVAAATKAAQACAPVVMRMLVGRGLTA